MEVATFAMIFALVGGMAAQVQSPLSSMLGQKLGILSSIFIVHLGGALVSLVVLIALGGENIRAWRSLPWYALAAGALGLVTVGSLSFAISRLGSAQTVTLFIVGQLLLAAVVDHFGWLGVPAHPMDLKRLAGMTVLIFGAWLITR